MKKLVLEDRRYICRPKIPVLTLEYYLVETPDFPSTTYGIRIHSRSDFSHGPSIHAEEATGLSHSKQEVLHLLHLCIRYQVTPTDLFSALDILMNFPHS